MPGEETVARGRLGVHTVDEFAPRCPLKNGRVAETFFPINVSLRRCHFGFLSFPRAVCFVFVFACLFVCVFVGYQALRARYRALKETADQEELRGRVEECRKTLQAEFDQKGREMEGKLRKAQVRQTAIFCLRSFVIWVKLIRIVGIVEIFTVVECWRMSEHSALSWELSVFVFVPHTSFLRACLSSVISLHLPSFPRLQNEHSLNPHKQDVASVRYFFSAVDTACHHST